MEFTTSADLPPVHRLLADAADLVERHGHTLVAGEARALLAEVRAAIQSGRPTHGAESLREELRRRVPARLACRQVPVFNLTGTVIHTNLDRAVVQPCKPPSSTTSSRGQASGYARWNPASSNSASIARTAPRTSSISEPWRNYTPRSLRCATTPDLRGVLVTSGKDAFVVGADIAEFLPRFAMREDPVADDVRAASEAFAALEDLPVPVVASHRRLRARLLAQEDECDIGRGTDGDFREAVSLRD